MPHPVTLSTYRGLFPVPMLELWEPVSQIAHLVNGRLVGGTAVGTHLQHRQSPDFDIMTFGEFSGVTVLNKLQSLGVEFSSVRSASKNQFHGSTGAVNIDVLRALRHHDVEPSQMRWIEPPRLISNMPVAGAPDLMASKLGVIEFRTKARDYVDIAELDRTGTCLLEEGVRHYLHRFGYDRWPRSLDRLVRLLVRPGHLDLASTTPGQLERSLQHLRMRAPHLSSSLHDIKRQFEASTKSACDGIRLSA